MAKLTRKDVDLISRDRRWDGFYKLDQLTLRHRRYDGNWTGVLDREVLERDHVVAVIPYDPVADRLVLIEQFRPAAISAHAFYADLPIWLIEVVAGIMKPGESEEEVAHRELLEETNLKAKKLCPITRYFTSQGCTNETIQLFYAEVDAPDHESLHGLETESEDIRLFTVSLSEAAAMVESGEICNSSCILSVQWLMLNKDRLASL